MWIMSMQAMVINSAEKVYEVAAVLCCYLGRQVLQEAWLGSSGFFPLGPLHQHSCLPHNA